MILSTSPNIICERRDGRILPLNETLKWISTTSISYVDMSFYEYAFPGQPFLTDRWQEWILSAKETAERLDLNFYQAHAYTYDFLSSRLTDEEKEWHEMLVGRSLECCRILGAKIVVTHPSTFRMGTDRKRISWERNREYFRRYADKVSALGMRAAVENMIRYPGDDYIFFSDPEEINAFTEEFDDDRLGICWDFEHGAILHLDQPAVLRLLGKKLYATHVSDAVTETYEPFMHVLPFTGETDWPELMSVLEEIGYDGAFSLEAHNFMKRIPDGLVPAALAYVSALGEFLVNGSHQ